MLSLKDFILGEVIRILVWGLVNLPVPKNFEFEIVFNQNSALGMILNGVKRTRFVKADDEGPRNEN